jgi:small conductance mechanosensitive channel
MFEPFLPMVIAAAVFAGILALLHYLLIARRADLGNEARVPRQLTLFFLTLTSLIILVVLAPLEESTRNQILGLIGLLMSAIVALSSTAFVTNFMAAIMLRVTRPFKVGDFITVGDHFGKVAERGLFDTEIQTESGELIAIPNALFISLPVKVIDRDGTIISTILSLGYDLHHDRIEDLLISAAKKMGLTDPYVHIRELGDFSVTYQVNGFLTEARTLLTARSKLNGSVLDTLHEAGIEIVSPNFARHIQQPIEQVVIPTAKKYKKLAKDSAIEDIAFAKANQAEALEELKQDIQAQISGLSQQVSESIGEEKDRLEAELESLNAKLAETNAPANGNKTTSTVKD